MSGQSYILHPMDAGRERIIAAIHAFLAKLPEAKAWVITIEQFRKKRTNPQNSALWGVAYPALMKATGQEVEDWHVYMLGEYFGWIESDMFGQRKRKPARTTTTGIDGSSSLLSTIEFAEFYNFIQRRAAEYGVDVPDPDPMFFLRDAA